MVDSREDGGVEARLTRMLRAEFEPADTPVDSERLVAELAAAARPGSRRRGLAAAAAVIGVAALAVLGGGLIARLVPIGGGPSSPETVAVSPSGSSRPTPSGTPFLPFAWELVELSVPSDLIDDHVAGVSADGGVILLVPTTAFANAHVVTPSEVTEVVVPDHTVGAQIHGQLGRDGTFAILAELGQLWRYDVAAKTYVRLPNPPGSIGVADWTLASNDRMLALTGLRASPEFGGITDTRLWTLDFETLAYTELGGRTDAIAAFAIADGGAVVVTDTSPEHDNSGWILYRIDPEGSDELLYDFRGGPGSVAALALAPDGTTVAFAIQGAGSWIVESPEGEARQVSEGQVIDFSPDGKLLRAEFADGHIEVIDRQGAFVSSVPAGPTGWGLLP